MYWFKSGEAASPNSCGLANGGLIMLTLLMIVAYALVLLFKIVITAGESRRDYFKFLGLVLLPPFILILYLSAVMD